MIASVPPLVKTISSSWAALRNLLHRARAPPHRRRSPRRRDNARRDGHWHIRVSAKSRIASSTARGFCAEAAAVEIDQRLAVDLARQNVEIGARLFAASKAGGGMILRCAVMPHLCQRRIDRVATSSRRSASRDLRHGVFEESVHQKRARLAFGNAAGAQIEQRIRIQIADRRAMGAFDVVGQDFQFRLEIGLGARRPAAAPWRSGGCRSHRRLAPP